MAEPIGEIPVKITGDWSDLQKSLEMAQTFAKGAGLNISSSLMTAGGGVAAFATAIVGIGVASFQAALEFDEAMDRIRSETGATGASLAGLEKSFENVFQNVPASAKQVADALSEITQRTGLMGEPLEELAEQLLNLAHLTGQQIGPLVEATTRMFGDWSIATENQSAALDTLFKTAQQTGIDIKKLGELVVQFGAPMRALGLSFEESTALMGKWEKEGVNLQTVLAGLKFALGNFTKAGREPAEAFRETIEAIKNAKTETEGLGITFSNFGKRAATDMFRAIKEGRFDIDALVASIQKSSETIQQATIDTRSFGEQWQILSNRVTAGLAALGKPLLAATNSILDMALGVGDVNKAFDKFEAWESKAKGAASSFDALNEAFRRGALDGKSFADVAKSIPEGMRLGAKDALDFGISVKLHAENTGKAIKKTATEIALIAEEAKKLNAFYDDSYRTLVKSQKEAEDQTNQFHKTLVNAGLRHPKFDQVEADLVSLSVQLNRGEISAEQFAKGMANLQAQLTTDIGEAMRVAARDAEILFESLNKLSASELGQSFKSNAVGAELMAASLKEISIQAEEASKGPLLSLDSALRILKITADDAGKATTTGLIALNAVLRDGDYDQVALAWAKMGSQIERLAKTNLPAAIEAWNALLESQKRNAPLGEQLELQEKITEAIIKAKTQRGIAANADIVLLDQIRREQDKLIQSTQKWGQLYVDVGKELDKLLDAYTIIDKAISAAFDTSENDRLSDSIKDLNRDLADHADAWEDAQRDASRAIEDINSDLERALAEELSDYNDFVRDIGEKYDEIVRNHRESQAEIVADANRSLRDQSIDYARFVEDTNEKLREAQAKGDERAVADLQKQLRRRAEDYTRYVNDTNAATAKRLADDRQAETKQTEGLQEELNKRTEAHVKAQADIKAKAAEEVAEVEAKLAEQKAAYDQFVADTTSKILELEDQMTNAFERIGSAFKQMVLGFVSEVGKMVASTLLQGYLDQIKKKILGAFNIPIPGSGSSPVNLPGGTPPGGDVDMPRAPGGGAPSGGGAGAGGGLAGTVSAVSGVVSAVSDVIANFQFYAMNKSLDIIVKHTLETVNELRNWRRDAWLQEEHLFHKLDDMWNEIRNVVDILRLIGQHGLGEGGGGLGELIAETINSRPASVEGSTDALLESFTVLDDGVSSVTPSIYKLDAAITRANESVSSFTEDTTRALAPLSSLATGVNNVQESASKFAAFLDAEVASRAQQQERANAFLEGWNENLTAITQEHLENGKRVAGRLDAYLDAVTGINTAGTTGQVAWESEEQKRAYIANYEAKFRGGGGWMTSQKEIDQRALRMGEARSHGQDVDVEGMTAAFNSRSANASGTQYMATVQVNAVEPSGRQIANATIKGLEERGIRVR